MIDFNYLEVHLVDHCNLNCAKCSHYAPIAEPRLYEPKQFEQDLLQVKNLLSNSTKHSDGQDFTLRLMGGEPLLHPNFIDFCIIARHVLPKAEIWVVSNGLKLVEKNDDFISTLNDNNISFSFTNYKNSPNYNNQDILTKVYKIHKHNILNHSGFMCTDLDFTKQNTDIFQSCTDNYTMLCTLLKDGKLYKCAIEAYNFNLQDKFNIQFPLEYSIKDNELDIYNCTYEQIIEFLNKPSTFCKYCNWCINPYTPWQASKKELSEWVEKI